MKKKNKMIFSVDILKATNEKSRIRIFKPVVRIRGFEFVLQCQGSTIMF